MNNTLKLYSLAVIILLSVLSCKKEDSKGPAGPQGPQGPSLQLANGGYISGTISGTRKDGVNFNESFNYNYYFPNATGSGTLDSNNVNYYSYNFSRQTNNPTTYNWASFSIAAISQTATTGSLAFSFYYSKELGGNKIFLFGATTTSLSTTTLTNLSFNSATKELSGSFSATIDSLDNSTTNIAYINGTFLAKLTPMVYKTYLESGIKTQ